MGCDRRTSRLREKYMFVISFFKLFYPDSLVKYKCSLAIKRASFNLKHNFAIEILFCSSFTWVRVLWQRDVGKLVDEDHHELDRYHNKLWLPFVCKKWNLLLNKESNLLYHVNIDDIYYHQLWQHGRIWWISCDQRKFSFPNNVNHERNNRIYRHRCPLVYLKQSEITSFSSITRNLTLQLLRREMISIYLDLCTAKSIEIEDRSFFYNPNFHF